VLDDPAEVGAYGAMPSTVVPAPTPVRQRRASLRTFTPNAIHVPLSPLAPLMTRGGRGAEEAHSEAHVPAKQAPAGHPPRLPSPHEQPRGSGDRPRPAPEGPRTTVGLIGRVGDRETFDALRRTPLQVRRGPMTVAYVPGGSDVRVAYAIGRRIGPAVVRNRVRRRLRAAARDIDVATGGLPAGAYLVSVRPDATERSYGELRDGLGDALAAVTDPPPGKVRR
jgi:ribonuclease P protein component